MAESYITELQPYVTELKRANAGGREGLISYIYSVPAQLLKMQTIRWRGGGERGSAVGGQG